MKKRFYSVSNLLFGSLITMLGFGACKSAYHAKEIETVYGPPSEMEEELQRQAQEHLMQEDRQRMEQQRIQRERREQEMKVVYGPPVSRWEHFEPGFDGVYDRVEEMPRFADNRDPMEWIAMNMRYPEKAKQQRQEGRVMVRFIVTDDGSISRAMVIRSACTLLDNEALRLIRTMPKWIPGKINGHAVAVRYTLPVVFKLDNGQKLK